MRAPRIKEKTFAVYYGYGPLPGIEAFELLALEPGGWKHGDLTALRQRGIRLMAYVSVLEAPPWIVEEAGLGYRDFLHLAEGPWRREEFGTVVVDPRSPTWLSYLRQHFRTLARGPWDGLFLDGLGNVEDPLVADKTGWLLPAAAEVVHLARQAVGDGLVVQNNGLWMLLPLVAEYLDGVVWEGDLSERDFGEPWALATQESLVRYANLYGITPMLLSEVPSGPDERLRIRAMNEVARRYGFLTYAAPSGYAHGVRSPGGTILTGKSGP